MLSVYDLSPIFTNQYCSVPFHVMLSVIAAVETIAVAAHLSIGKAFTVARVGKDRNIQT